MRSKLCATTAFTPSWSAARPTDLRDLRGLAVKAGVFCCPDSRTYVVVKTAVAFANERGMLMHF